MPTGKTNDAGWQIGVSTTFDHPLADVWNLITDPEGVSIWLGNGVTIAGNKGETYETADGTVGEIRSFHAEERIRLTWQPKDWDHNTIVQLVMRRVGDRTRLTLHQERLADAVERDWQRGHWRSVASNLANELDARTG